MSSLGSPERPLRVAIVGSGPTGFYAAQDLLSRKMNIKVDMFEKLPVPFGLVRYGVAPDHPKIKNVTKVFEKTAENPNFSFLGNVTVGKNITVFELQKFYDAIIFTIGAEADRKLGISGEDLVGSYTATEFVAWYNGHPDFQDHHFDFSHQVAVIIGQGNVAMDVARILSKTADELRKTDISQHALEILAESKIKEVHVYGRRGPVQAAFTSPEIKEMGELADCYPVIDPKDLELNEASAQELEDPVNAGRKKNYEILRHFTTITPNDRKRKFVLHFKRSPIEIIGKGRVQKVRFEINRLVGEANKQKVRGTGKFEEIDCGILFRSVGYRGIPIKGLPFSDQSGVIPNQAGRVMDSEAIFTGWYAAGWIKRGATGIIGTNKPCSEETVKSLLEDLDQLNPCEAPSTDEVLKFLKEREVRVVSFADWKKIDAAEIE
ncbi:MAG: FAD-dependent oxidoreductase, partial [Candidatus Omnitrophica bacterium]|nr:FAD-dependent oxidoreductase [Candidatus Omnitrophota bacterium]